MTDIGWYTCKSPNIFPYIKGQHYKLKISENSIYNDDLENSIRFYKSKEDFLNDFNLLQ